MTQLIGAIGLDYISGKYWFEGIQLNVEEYLLPLESQPPIKFNWRTWNFPAGVSSNFRGTSVQYLVNLVSSGLRHTKDLLPESSPEFAVLLDTTIRLMGQGSFRDGPTAHGHVIEVWRDFQEMTMLALQDTGSTAALVDAILANAAEFHLPLLSFKMQNTPREPLSRASFENLTSVISVQLSQAVNTNLALSICYTAICLFLAVGQTPGEAGPDAWHRLFSSISQTILALVSAANGVCDPHGLNARSPQETGSHVDPDLSERLASRCITTLSTAGFLHWDLQYEGWLEDSSKENGAIPGMMMDVLLKFTLSKLTND
ncbi:hypothetical protein BC629DRAFT_1444110 [Irpex lacteus]|nr:hypothetical protein BC629DRAFT_1444110 [Irpex lacteus]